MFTYDNIFFDNKQIKMNKNLNTWINSELKPRVKSTVKPDLKIGINDWFKFLKIKTKNNYSGKNK